LAEPASRGNLCRNNSVGKNNVAIVFEVKINKNGGILKTLFRVNEYSGFITFIEFNLSKTKDDYLLFTN
jgi:hypothetical protein